MLGVLDELLTGPGPSQLHPSRHPSTHRNSINNNKLNIEHEHKHENTITNTINNNITHTKSEHPRACPVDGMKAMAEGMLGGMRVGALSEPLGRRFNPVWNGGGVLSRPQAVPGGGRVAGGAARRRRW